MPRMLFERQYEAEKNRGEIREAIKKAKSQTPKKENCRKGRRRTNIAF